MGIRFYCDHCGRRLNVKTFLAGKKALCPHCGGKIRVPREDQAAPIRSLEATPTTGVPSPPGHSEQRPPTARSRQERSGNEEASEVSPAGTGWPSDPTTPSPAPRGNRQANASGAPDRAADADAEDRIDFEELQLDDDSHASVPDGAGSGEFPVPTNNDPAGTTDDGDSHGESDLGSNADRDAVWYAIPSGEKQYGPVTRADIERWIREGRITQESYVWRDGWTDWQQAGMVFPDSFRSRSADDPMAIELDPNLPSAETFAPTGPLAWSDSVPSAAPTTGAAFKRSASMTPLLLAAGALLVVAVILGVVLYLVV